jgi:hypothetical protein
MNFGAPIPLFNVSSWLEVPVPSSKLRTEANISFLKWHPEWSGCSRDFKELMRFIYKRDTGGKVR